MNFIRFITNNYVLDVGIVAWALAQLMKFFIVLIKHRKLNFNRLFGAGGMPSSHSALVTALTVAMGQIRGVYSPEFAVTAVFSFIVMFDAFGVRKAAGDQAKVLNYITSHWREQTPQAFGRELKELLGHTPFEVFAGALLGVAVALGMYLLLRPTVA